MSCFSPLTAWINTGKDGKKHVTFKPIKSVLEYENQIQIPCGQCIGCRLNYSKQWADRIMLETKEYKDNYWLTLTYNEENVPFTYKTNENGEIISNKILTLEKKEISKFIKVLRKKWEREYKHQGIKFYGCGEYGDKYGRPHYHIIIFNLPITDLKQKGKTKTGFPMYESKTIQELWGKGNVLITDVTWETAAYTARYMMKKRKGKSAKEEYEKLCLEPEYVRMSRQEAIGKRYYEKNKENIIKNDEIFTIQKEGKINKTKVPRYFEKLIEREEKDTLDRTKNKRQIIADNQKEIKLKNTSLSENEYNLMQLLQKTEQIKKLLRPFEKGQ